jgi:hypothetical protein
VETDIELASANQLGARFLVARLAAWLGCAVPRSSDQISASPVVAPAPASTRTHPAFPHGVPRPDDSGGGVWARPRKGDRQTAGRVHLGSEHFCDRRPDRGTRLRRSPLLCRAMARRPGCRFPTRRWCWDLPLRPPRSRRPGHRLATDPEGRARRPRRESENHGHICPPYQQGRNRGAPLGVEIDLRFQRLLKGDAS